MCKACAAETFSTTENAAQCDPWDTCFTSFRRIDGTAKSDATCDGYVLQMGGTGADNANDVAIDELGNIYVVGTTMGMGNWDDGGTVHVFVTLYDWAGALKWTTEFGTGTVDYGLGIGIDSDHNIYVVGSTYGVMGGTIGNHTGQSDGYIAKLDWEGEIAWITQFGSPTLDDTAEDIAVDAGGTAYLVGSTLGKINPIAVSQGGRDAYLAKCTPDGGFSWFDQFGTAQDDAAVAVNLRGGAVDVAGNTTGSLGGTNKGLTDVFVRRYGLNKNLQFSTQLGTSEADLARSVATDSGGHAYVVGITKGEFPDYSNAGLMDAFLGKLDDDGTPLWTHQFGTIEPESVASVVIDANDSPYVVGSTDGELDDQTPMGSTDVFVRLHDVNGGPQWTRLYGGPQVDGASRAVFAGGKVYIAGSTDSSLPGWIAQGQGDGFVMKVTP